MNEDRLALMIFEDMQRHNRGRQNAEPRNILKFRFGLAPGNLEAKDFDRKFRRAYAKIPKCACPEGHFIPTCTAEVEEFRRYSLLTRPPAEVDMKVRRIYATWPELAPRPKHEQLSLDMGQAKTEARP